MTKFILHGGETGRPSPRNTNFFAEMTRELPEPVHILCVYFAREKEQWNRLFKEDQKRFYKTSQEKKLQFECTKDNREIFIEQVNHSDVIYIRGGRKDPKDFLKTVDNLGKLLQVKVVAGSSAGANILSRYYFSTDENCLKEGLGILPAKVFCHYDNSRHKQLKELKQHGEDLKVYILPETRYTIIKISDERTA